MSKSKRKPTKQRGQPLRPPPPPFGHPQSSKQQGLKAFRAGRMTEAIQLWEGLGRTEPGVAPALAEAYFRRALAYKAEPQQQLADLRQAIALAPDEPRYQYHQALALHRRGDLSAALAAYRSALAHDPKRPGAVFAAALAAVEEDASVDLDTLPGLSEQERTVLETVAALLQGATSVAREAHPSSWLTRLLAGFGRPTDHATAVWKGLALLNAGDVNGAREALTAAGARAPRSLEAVRHYYAGVAAARASDLEVARSEWEAARAGGMDTSWLRDNLRVLYTEQAVSQARDSDWSTAAKSALAGLEVAPGNAALTEIAVTGLDQEAHAAASAGNWKTAADRWSQARELISAATGVGSPRPILQNLALAYERLEQWQMAAETWRAMLRTRPRRKSAKEDEAGALSDAQWAWVRKRVIQAYQKADNPGEAVAVFRQAIKADPGDMDARLQLVEALVANEQENAAQNELIRILERDPSHVEARLRLAELYMEGATWYAAQGQLIHVLEQKPTDPALRQRLVHDLIEVGEGYHERLLLDLAHNIFEQALTLAPDDYTIQIALARVALDERRQGILLRGATVDVERYHATAHAHLDRALALAPDQPDAYLQVFQCWVIEREMASARDVLALALASVQPTPTFFISLGLICLIATVPPLPLSFPGLPPSAPLEAPAEWRDLAVELFERAIALQPDDSHTYRRIVDSLLRRQPSVALPYAERLVRLTPDDPEAFLALGILQGVLEQVAGAKETLRHALQLARRQRNPELEQTIQTVRQDVGNPMFPLMFRLGPLDLPEDELDDLDWM